MKISIAMAVYNGTNFLDEQLASFLTQTRLPDELVVVDDCSTDHTVEVLKRFSRSAPFAVEIVRNKINSGCIESFSRAISSCHGDLIFPADHDDIWKSNKLSNFHEQFERDQKLGLLWGNVELIDENSQLLGRTKFEDSLVSDIRNTIEQHRLAERILRANVVGGATSAFRAEYIPLICPIPPLKTFIHDAWIGLIVSALADVKYLDNGEMLYRQHQSQQVGATPKACEAEGANVDRTEFFNAACATWENRLSDLSALQTRLMSIGESREDTASLARSLDAVSQERKVALQGLAHMTRRRSLPHSPARFFSIAREFVSGGYVRYSNGAKSVGRDVLYR